MTRKRFLSPLTWPVLSFAAVIAAGGLLLSLPTRWQANVHHSFLDAWFLSTSAVCVTGLTPVDISAVLSPLGKGVLLCLFQLGGVGVMTYTSLIFLLWRNHVPFNSREAVGQALLWGDFSLPAFLRQVLGIMLGIELVAAFGLWCHDPVFFHPFSAVFHAVSAFCNAGFSLCSAGLMPWRDDVVVNIIIACSVFLGAIGFGVLREFLGICTGGKMGAPSARLSRFSRLVLKTSLLLVLAGFVSIFCLEYFREGMQLQYHSPWDLAGVVLFHTAAARTAGFATVDVATFSQASLMVLMALMFIGGGPGSCAGGIKVVAFRVLVGYIASQFRGDRQIVLEGRGVPAENIARALTMFFLYATTIVLALFLLQMTESDLVLDHARQNMSQGGLLFECVSALGTVGLSLNMTSALSEPGKGILMCCMFAGRVGMLSLLMAVQSLQAKKPYAVAEAQLPIG